MFPADVQLRSCAPAVYLSRENVAVYTTGQLPGEPWSAGTAMPLAARVHAPVLIRRDRQQSPACSRWNAGARVPAFGPGRILAAHLAARPVVLLRSVREPRCSASHLPPAAITYGFACSAFVSRAPLVPLETGGGGGGTSPLAPRGARLWAPRPTCDVAAAGPAPEGSCHDEIGWCGRVTAVGSQRAPRSGVSVPGKLARWFESRVSTSGSWRVC